MKVMHWLAVFCLFAILLRQSMPLLIYAHFKANQQELADKYCENKAKPELECNGQCHLKKEIAKAEEPVQPTKTTKLIEPEVLVWSIVNKSLTLEPAYFIQAKTTLPNHLVAVYLPPFLSSPEKPPSLVA